MLDNIIKFSVENKLIVGLLTLGLILWGGYSLTQLPIDAVPDITNNQVQVVTSSPTLAAAEVERLITFPVEITMATIPHVDEIRSFSRFGLSVVTLVFEEHVDVYWARQQVNERLTEVQAQIPPQLGQPGMTPVTTGLGEIYQYVVGAAPGYEDEYNARDLRTIQDWMVRRQLLGTEGVADVSSFGGYLKQYEVAVDPDQLKALNVSITDVFQALEANNENSGGAYIEKNRSAYFIRSEGLAESLADIASMPVKVNEAGIPILIRDVATVQYGDAVRYGATTRNGQGEVVSAIVMMLKGANSAQVIENVKERIEQIRQTLPEGVTIEPFLDRSKLINNAIGTVTTNLTEGALIVIFVLLLLLGNFRAGLIVASVIPLALLFAFAMMRLFGVSGNLMSLGAIDFGLIVDGAVIIVEATLHHLGIAKRNRVLSQQEMDLEVYRSASKIRKSAAFGEIIILIVYLPILALVGTEGKMFRPMAQTVGFAILGAFLLSLTYVPMMSALVLSKKSSAHKTLPDRLIELFQRLYTPIIRQAMRLKPLVLALALGLVGLATWTFSQLGGEFIPTLEEGDFAVETRVITGSSLENTIAATTQAEQILLDNFPEATQVVAKIGAGEIPTDPMPIEAADLMIILKDKSEWETASSREELANAMAEALEVIPGVAFGFQQPIQMRFNELMTGVRQDVAVKIYGENLNDLSDYARQIGQLAGQVEGAVDLYIEEVTGVPQIVISYKRDQLAKYGLTISEVNKTIQTTFAGSSAGMVYENERRFDLVVRLQENKRHDLSAVRNLFIARKDGHQIPLYQVAQVEIKEGPYQIQRDNTRRRILVAFNVRNRDVESVVNELKEKITTSVVLAPGYSIAYGGQFENLVEARKRLSFAVPLALLLILVLLYFTFRSIKQSLLIFTAIPLSAIGGIFALWLRDMPFSISAGVGFIALFGVAVLNGIVLIAEFNHLKQQGVADILERIYQGTRVRLRPVIMTASVASLGFLPMALSTSSGAEVQKPLATVVIGGLITATFLTLVVLPILYYYFEKGIRLNRHTAAWLVGACLLSPSAFAQPTPLRVSTLDDALSIALANNPTLRGAALETEQQRAKEKASWNLPRLEFSWTHGQYNSVQPTDNNFKVLQRIAFPTVYAKQHDLARSKTEALGLQEIATQQELVLKVKLVWYGLWSNLQKGQILSEQDSLYRRYAEAAALRFASGEINLLEKTAAEAQVAEVTLMLRQQAADQQILIAQLRAILNPDEGTEITPDPQLSQQNRYPRSNPDVSSNPTLAYARSQVQVADQQEQVARAQRWPDLQVGYFNQSLNGPGMDIDGQPTVYESSDRFMGFQVGLAIPLLGLGAQQATVRAARLHREAQQAQALALAQELNGQAQMLWQEFQKLESSLDYFEENVLPQAQLMLQQAQIGQEEGQIGYVEYVQALSQTLRLKLQYQDLVSQYHSTAARIDYLTGLR